MRQRTRTQIGSLAAALVLSLIPAAQAAAGVYWQCVPFARLMSGIQIFGDARTWWDQATGVYDKGFAPKVGSVLCFRPTDRMKLGHVAVVSRIVTDRVIQITHANWSMIGGARGQVEKDVTVIDVSPGGDWSQVKVWYDPIRDLGTTTYPTYGFIYPNAQALQMAQLNARLAVTQNNAFAAVQSAASQVVQSAAPMQILNQAADTTDALAALIQAATGGGDKSDKSDK
ncbi:surface antigen [Caulobacter ginsengisoli]|uniref:Surface antigen n=1 Tax=Caulobacter ginsengisoli TaxID=400775 RepID=A0ABU0IW76_9CAUL|nr:CHAP domain-containing protein [Caulobacter ginsengisoli]MDQ0466272.1 surface antigen [Caulobacter ginsengisoli]